MSHWLVVVNLLAGTLLGAWIGAAWATRMRSATLHRVLVALLVLIAAALAWHHFGHLDPLLLEPVPRTLLGVAAGIGVIASVVGVAGGELLIPTIVLLFAVDIKVAGSLSLAVSLPTMRHRPRRSPPGCRPRRRADPAVGRVATCVISQGLVPRGHPRLPTRRLRLAAGTPSRRSART